MKKLVTLLIALASIIGCTGLESPSISLSAPWYYDGTYKDNATYHSADAYISVVFFGNAYYVAKEAAPDDFSGIAPTNQDYWQILTGNRIGKVNESNADQREHRP